MNELEASIVTILSTDGTPVGAGFLLTENLAVTCAHVIAEIDDSSHLNDEIEVNFPFIAQGKKYHAQVVYWNERDDIAGIKLLEPVPLEATSAPLVNTNDLSRHKFKVYGFPKGHDDGVWAQGVIIDTIANKWIQIEDTKEQGIQIQGGFSGTPVWDEQLQGVVGMVVAAKDDRTEKMAFCVSAQTLMTIWPELGANISIPACPYRGLFAFREQDANLFFGREHFIEELLGAVEHRSLVAIVGASGSGKSSVVFAGLLSRLHRDSSLIILDLRPGKNPFAALASSIIPLLEPNLTESKQMEEAGNLTKILREQDYALSDAFNRIKKKNPTCRRILLYIDQFEELYTSVEDSIQRNQFIDTLLNTIKEQGDNLTLLFTFRADFLGQALAHEPFATALQKHQILYLAPMKREELQQAIERPAEIHNVKFEPGLTDLILDHITKDPGALPLLEFALTQIWERQENRMLTVKSYRQIGGIEEALTHYADNAFANLDPNQLEIAHRLFTQLVIPGVGIGDTRRLAMRSEINETDESIVEEFVTKRLLVTDRTPTGQETVEIVHEALIHGCKTMRDWIEKDREFLAWQAQLRSAIQIWKDNENKETALLSGINLSNAEKWLYQRPDDLNQEQRLFILLSAKLKKRGERRRNWILAGVILSITAILSTLTVAYFLIKDQRDVARAREIAAQSEILSSAYPQLSLLLAIEAMNITSPSLPYAEQALRDASGNIGGIVLSGHTWPVDSLAFSPDKHWLATGSWDTTVRLWDLTATDPSSKSIALKDHNDAIITLAFSPNGHWLATGSQDETTRLYDLSGDLNNLSADSLLLLGHANEITALAFSPDKHWLATGSSDTTILLWDLNAKDIPASSIPLVGPLNGIIKLTFSPNGRWLAILDGSEIVFLWDVANPAANPVKIMHPKGDITTFAFSPDSQWIATGGGDTIVHLRNLKVDHAISTDVQMFGHTDKIWTMAFSPDGHWLATGGLDFTVRLWDFTANDIQASSKKLVGHKDAVRALAFSSQGHWLVTGSPDGTAQLWDITHLVDNANLPIDPIVLYGNLGVIGVVTFSPDERWMASISSDNVAEIWNLTAGHLSENPVILRDIDGLSFEFSPDGHWLGTKNASLNVTARLWNMSTNDPFANSNILSATGGRFIAMSPRGDWFATGSAGATVQLWSPTDFRANPVILNHQTKQITALAFNSKGDLMATGASDDTTCLWNIPPNTASARPGFLRCFPGHTDEVSALSFSPDGHWLATGSYDRTVKLWDLTATNSSAPLRVLEVNEPILTLSFSPNGYWLAVGMKNETAAKLWNVSDLSKSNLSKPVLLPGNKSEVKVLAFSPDGHWLATGSSGWDATIQLWNLTADDPSLDPILLTGANYPMTGVNIPIAALSISPNGHWLAVAGLSPKIYIWDLTSGNLSSNLIKPTVELSSLSGSNTTLAFSPDEQWLAAGGTNNTIHLWNLSSKNSFKDSIILNGHKSLITGLAFSPDGRWLISGGWDHTIRYWDMNIDKVLVTACKLAGRNMSRDEWSQYLSSPYRITCPQWPTLDRNASQ